MNDDDFILRIKCNNNVKMIIKTSREDRIREIMNKIKVYYAVQHSQLIEIGAVTDDRGFEIINDISISSLCKSGDVLCVYIREVGQALKRESKNREIINYDYDLRGDEVKSLLAVRGEEVKQRHKIEQMDESMKIPEVLVQRDEGTEIIKPDIPTEIGTEEVKKEKKPRKKRTTKPKEGETVKTLEEDPKRQKTEVKPTTSEDKDPFSIFKPTNEKENLEEEPLKFNEPKKVSEVEEKNIKGLKKKSKVDYNAL